MKTWDSFIKPVVVLGVICFISSVLLAFTNSITAPIIEANEIETANEIRQSLLPEADSFTEINISVEGVIAAYVADNGVGYVITASSKGYGGDVPVMVAFNPEGEILAVEFLSNSETPGLGQKILQSSFGAQFSGLSGTLTIDDIDAISGATISSKAALSAVNAAVEGFQAVTGSVTEISVGRG